MILLIASLLTAFAPDAYELNQDGRNLLDQHRYTAAARMFRKAVDLAESELGPNDPATAMMLRNLALACVHARKSAEAEESAKAAYSIIESRFGAADPSLTPILNVLAECYAATGRIAEAQKAAEQAVSIGPSAGAHYGTALHNLGSLREFSGDVLGAAALYRRAVDAKIATLGAEHPYVALSRTALSRVQRQQLARAN